jgi:hypothetical protein
VQLIRPGLPIPPITILTATILISLTIPIITIRIILIPKVIITMPTPGLINFMNFGEGITAAAISRGVAVVLVPVAAGGLDGVADPGAGQAGVARSAAGAVLEAEDPAEAASAAGGADMAAAGAAGVVERRSPSNIPVGFPAHNFGAGWL